MRNVVEGIHLFGKKSSFTQDKTWTLQYDINTKKLENFEGMIASTWEIINNE